MHIKKIIIGGIAALTLAGCTGMSDLERGTVGAATGAVAAGALGGNVVTGAAIGGAAGALCDDANVRYCQ